jgi:dihydroneopterin aldolase/2-amino-4-hydroxy-6-hydroxymethyldihydropteridine diphosphokinase
MKVWLSLGSNLEQPFQQLERAIKYLREKCYITVLRLSEAIETKPIGYTPQPDFANQIIQIETSLSARELLIFLMNAESHLGRIPGQKGGPRLIDLDILFYGEDVIKTSELSVPHHAIPERGFLLKLLNDMIPEFVHPETLETINSMYDKYLETGGIQ